MGQTNNEGTWEEDMYWNHFQSLRFTQSLKSGFHEHLAIPEKFSHKLKEKLPPIVAIRGPSGDKWNVELASKESTMFCGDGWQEFVKDHSLQENDILILKYNQESCFDILIFDPRSMCEKEAAYFVRKHGTKPGSDGQSSRKVREFSCEEHNTSAGFKFSSYGYRAFLNDENLISLKNESRSYVNCEVPPPPGFGCAGQSSSKRIKKEACLVKPETGGQVFEKPRTPAGKTKNRSSRSQNVGRASFNKHSFWLVAEASSTKKAGFHSSTYR